MAVPVVLKSRSREVRRLIATRNGRHARRGTLKDSFRGLIRRKIWGTLGIQIQDSQTGGTCK